MYKYTGDSIMSASFTVLVPKPLDNRTVVNNLQELYSIPAAYAYVGMTVANIDNGNIYMLVDKTKIYEKSGWRASYESIQIIACTYDEYQTWQSNTDEYFQPIDDSLTYIHLDTYYYIYEDSLPEGEANLEYIKRSDFENLVEIVNTKASTSALHNTNETIALIIENYASKEFVEENYAPLSMFDINDTESFIRTNFFTKDEALGKFVKFSDLAGGEDIDEGDYIFVTQNQYTNDLQALEQYKQNVADEFLQCLKVGDNGELDSITVSLIKSKTINNQLLIVNVTPLGMDINGDPIAKISDIPPHVTLTKQEYEALVENNLVDPDTYYHITDDLDTYVLRSYLESVYTKTVDIRSYISQQLSDKVTDVELTTALSNYYPKSIIDRDFVTNDSLSTTLEDYVTVAMLGGDGDIEGQFIFVKASDYQEDQEAASQLRQNDLELIEEDYVKKNSDTALNSLETSIVKNDLNVLSIAEVLKFNNKKLALDEDVPVIQVISQDDFEELTKDPNVYYFVYNTDPDLAFLTLRDLDTYTTKIYVDNLNLALRQRVEALEELVLQLQERLDALDGGGEG